MCLLSTSVDSMDRISGQPPLLEVTLSKTVAKPGESITITVIVTSDVGYDLSAAECGCTTTSNFIEDPQIEDKYTLTIS